ncbi:MAG: ABC transporter ATP-binding protein [Hyphomicrobiales bacterium]|nr:ABC transporter ATP-binding protein [Hyphomicrobiales bacterium]
MLKVDHLSVAYGGLTALSDICLEVRAGELVSVVGPNGAGKSTLFKAISGVVRAGSGSVTFEGEDILQTRPFQRAHAGIAHVPEGRHVFPAMSVQENLEMGAYALADARKREELFERIFALFPILAERRRQYAGTLSGGEQQMLAIGRGLASAPKLMMFDEPSMGLAPAVADTIFERIAQLHKEDGMTILLVEQRVAEAMENCDRGYVLQTGRIVMSGTYEELSSDDNVRRAYLGM